MDSWRLSCQCCGGSVDNECCCTCGKRNSATVYPLRRWYLQAEAALWIPVSEIRLSTSLPTVNYGDVTCAAPAAVGVNRAVVDLSMIERSDCAKESVKLSTAMGTLPAMKIHIKMIMVNPGSYWMPTFSTCDLLNPPGLSPGDIFDLLREVTAVKVAPPKTIQGCAFAFRA